MGASGDGKQVECVYLLQDYTSQRVMQSECVTMSYFSCRKPTQTPHQELVVMNLVK